MPSQVFKRADLRFLAASLANDTTHAGISAFELSLGISTEGNKTERATQVVRKVFERTDADGLFLELLNYLYVENPYADTSSANSTYAQLQERVLAPRGVVVTDNGFAFEDGRDIDSFDRPAPAVASPAAQPALAPWADFAVEPSGTPPTAVNRDRQKIFVVHGRDLRPVEVLKQFLIFLGLHMMPWSEAVRLTGETQPHTYDVVKAGMSGAAAVIVIFSPDDLGRVKDDFSTEGDADRAPRGQARQNVTLEAGMAFATERERTIFVQSAPTREISDIAGFNWVKLDGAWDSRNDLRSRLLAADAAVRAGDYDLRDALAGPFRVGDS